MFNIILEKLKGFYYDLSRLIRILLEKLKEINYNFFRYGFYYVSTRKLLGIRKYKQRRPKEETNGIHQST